MKTIFSALCRALSVGQGAVLCSVIASEGSTPRGAGAKMLVTEDGSTVGTVGGGAVEYRCAALARELCREKRSQLQAYDPVHLVSLCRQHQDGCSLTSGAQTPGNLIAVYLGQHNIQDQQVIDVKLCIGKTAFSVIGCLGNKAAAR